MNGKIKIGKVILILVLVFIFISCSIEPTSKVKEEPSSESFNILMEASSLVNTLKYQEARKMLEDNYKVFKDNDLVLNTYGFWEYHIFQDYDRAVELYKRAIKLNPDNSEHYLGLGNAYEDWGDYKEAIKYYNKAVKKIENYDNVPLNPQISIAYKDIGRCYIKLNETENAIKALEKSTENNPYSIDANAMLHKLYVDKEEYNKAYMIWKNDNFIDGKGGSIYNNSVTLNTLYKNEIDNNEKNHYKLAKLYDELSLYDEALVEYEKALNLDKTNEEINRRLVEIKKYLLFREEFIRLADGYYRDRSINGSIEEMQFYKRIKPAYDIIAEVLPNKTYKEVSSWINSMNNEISKKFNIRIQNITANGTMLGAHFGRIIDNSTIQYSLWGKEIDLRLITLKNMYSNGLDYWRTNENGGVGGWSLSTSEIVRVIKNNEIDNVLKLTSIYNEEAKANLYEMGALEYQIEDKEKEPLELYFTPNIQVMLIEKQMNIEFEKGRNEGLNDRELQRYIFDKFEKDFLVKTSIYVHESQHSIDSKYRTNFRWFGENEYRPKLSQLAYGDMPFLSLQQFYETSIGNEVHDTHSMANTRVFKDLVQYIFENSEKYPQIDTNKNILAQLDKLSEEELKEAAINIFEKTYPNEKYSIY